jgi:hypothetical protein
VAYNRSQVAKLLSAAETALFEMSLADRIKALSAAQLRGKRQRARSLRDKANDQLRRQKLESRSRTGSKLGRSGAANVRTEKKAQILAETLQRFEKRLEQVERERPQRAEAGRSSRPSAGRKVAQAVPRAPKGRTAATAPARGSKAPSTGRARAR